MEKLTELLRTLTGTMTVSGFEKRNAAKIKETAEKYVPDFFTDAYVTKSGSVILARRGRGENRRRLAFDAHLDTIGFVVSEISEGGYLKVKPIGGIDGGILPSSEAVIYGKKELYAVFSSVPPHLSKNDVAPETDKLFVDTGFKDKERLSEIVSVGTPAAMLPKFSLLANNRISSPGLDDKSCIGAILEAARLLKDENIENTDVYCCFTSGEERGGNGAFHLFHEIKPDACIVLDVNFAKEKGSRPGEYGVISEGSMISISSVTNPALTQMCVETARNEGLPYQIVTEMTGTGTNADIIPRTGTGIAAAVVSIPIKYMHSSVETACLDDIETTAKLLKSVALRYDKSPVGLPVYHKGGGELD